MDYSFLPSSELDADAASSLAAAGLRVRLTVAFGELASSPSAFFAAGRRVAGFLAASPSGLAAERFAPGRGAGFFAFFGSAGVS
jgi:hypothetical protein